MSPDSFPEVRVFEIQRGETGEFVIPEDQPGLDLGARYDPRARTTEERLRSLLDRIKSNANRFFILEWNGNKVPRGVKLLDRQIGYTQNGFVTDVMGKQMGHYDRLIEFGGENRRLQQMLVYMSEPKTPKKS